MDNGYCHRCKFLDKMYDRDTGVRYYFCRFKNTFLKYLKVCPLQSDDCYK